MEKIGFLVNDKLTCIPGTKTFWHDLLEGIDGLSDLCTGSFNGLAEYVEDTIALCGSLNNKYIIRNATYFPRIKSSIHTIAFLQDRQFDKLFEMQVDVIGNADITVFNDSALEEDYQQYCKKSIVIPVGVDSDLFKPQFVFGYYDKIKPNSVLYIGDDSIYPKGFDTLMDVVENCEHNFVFVMKNDFSIVHPRIKVYNRVSHKKLVEIMCSCHMCICTSRYETQHLAGIECAMCNLPILTTNVGIYKTFENTGWGRICNNTQDFIDGIEHVIKNRHLYSPRTLMEYYSLDKQSCINKWKKVIDSLYA